MGTREMSTIQDCLHTFGFILLNVKPVSELEEETMNISQLFQKKVSNFKVVTSNFTKKRLFIKNKTRYTVLIKNT